MTDPHDRFQSWLAGATPGDPPRDLALHASGCANCVAQAAALDALSAIDLGLAPDPPSHVTAPRRPAGLAPIAQGAAGLAAFAVMGMAVLLGGAALVGQNRSPAGEGMALASQPPAEGVLGGAAGTTIASATPTATSTATPSPSSETTASAEPTPAAARADSAPTRAPAPAPTPPPVQNPSPPNPAPTPTPPPPPTATATSTAMPTPTPTPTPTPSPPPTATATPTPTPTPTPSSEGESASSDTSCSNGGDDDGDLLADLLDPGCLVGSREADR